MHTFSSIRRWPIRGGISRAEIVSRFALTPAETQQVRTNPIASALASSIWRRLDRQTRHRIMEAVGMHVSRRDDEDVCLEVFQRALGRGDLVVVETPFTKETLSFALNALADLPSTEAPILLAAATPKAAIAAAASARKSKKRPPPGRINIEGTFADDGFGPAEREQPPGRDAETEAVVTFKLVWKCEFNDDSTAVAIYLTFHRHHVKTHYWGNAEPRSPHARHATLGGHEDRHKAFAQTWWSTAHFSKIVERERFGLDFDLPDRVAKDEVEAEALRQGQAIADYLNASHVFAQEEALDDGGGREPVFKGRRR